MGGREGLPAGWEGLAGGGRLTEAWLAVKHITTSKILSVTLFSMITLLISNTVTLTHTPGAPNSKQPQLTTKTRLQKGQMTKQTNKQTLAVNSLDSSSFQLPALQTLQTLQTSNT